MTWVVIFIGWIIISLPLVLKTENYMGCDDSTLIGRILIILLAFPVYLFMFLFYGVYCIFSKQCRVEFIDMWFDFWRR